MTSSSGSSNESKKISKKVQISLEYMMIFAFAFLVVAVVLGYLYMVSFHNTTYTNSYCYLTPNLPCQGMYVIGNSVAPDNAKAYVIFTNNEGTGVYVRPGSFNFYPTSANVFYSGECVPANIPNGGVAICNVTMNNIGSNIQSGAQVNPKFSIAYSVCNNNYCDGLGANAPVLNTTGTGTTYVALSAPSLYYVVINNNSINVTVDGVKYTAGAMLAVFKNVRYTLFGNPPAGYGFGSWTGTGGVIIETPDSQATVFTATSNGTIYGSYLVPTPTSTSTSSTSTSSTSTSTTSTSTTSTSTSTTSTTSSTSTSSSSTSTTTSTSTSTSSTTTILASGTFVYVANCNIGCQVNANPDNITIINTATGSVAGYITHGVYGFGASGVAFSPSGTYAYVPVCGDVVCVGYTYPDNVAIVNTATNTVTGLIASGVSSPSGVAFSPSGTYAYVGSVTNNTMIISTATNTVTGHIPASSGIDAVAMAPSGAYAYLTSLGGNNVLIVNTATNTVTGEITSGLEDTGGVAFSPSGTYAYVSNCNECVGSAVPDNVAIINTATNTVTGSITVSGAPYGLAVSPSGTELYVGLNSGGANVGSIDIINIATGTVTGTISDGHALPVGIAFST